MATNPYINKVQYSGNTLIDISDTTATPDKVQTGFKFYDASGAPRYGTASQGQGITITDTVDPDAGGTIRTITGQVIEAHDPMGANATLIKRVVLDDMTLAETKYETAKAGTAAAEITTRDTTGETVAAQMNLYNYYIRYYATIKYVYTSSASPAAMILTTSAVYDDVIARTPQGYSQKLAENFNYNNKVSIGNTTTVEYYTTAGARNYAFTNVGIYIYDTTYAYSNRTADNFTFTPYTPRLYLSAANTTYFSATNRTNIDPDNTIIKRWIEVYQIDKETAIQPARYRASVAISNMLN